VLSNVFLHLHPAKINRDAVRYSYTWGMGGITFYLFLVLTFTGVLLMFYYHPSKVQAFRDVLYLEHDVPFGKLLRNMHRWAAHLMVIAVELHMFRVFLTGSYKKPREFNWNVGVILLVCGLQLYGQQTASGAEDAPRPLQIHHVPSHGLRIHPNHGHQPGGSNHGILL